jgi:ribonuclease HI
LGAIRPSEHPCESPPSPHLVGGEYSEAASWLLADTHTLTQTPAAVQTGAGQGPDTSEEPSENPHHHSAVHLPSGGHSYEYRNSDKHPTHPPLYTHKPFGGASCEDSTIKQHASYSSLDNHLSTHVLLDYQNEHYNTQQRAHELEHELDMAYDLEHARVDGYVRAHASPHHDHFEFDEPHSPSPPLSPTNHDMTDDEDITDLTFDVLTPLASPPSFPAPVPPRLPAGKVRGGKAAKPDLISIPDLRHEALGAADFLSASLLAFPAPGKALADDTRARAVAAMALFNGVVWFERSYYFKMMSVPPCLEEATNWLADVAALDLLSSFGPKAATGLGSAGKRSAAQKKAAKDYGNRLLASVLPHSLVAFTDGSANPNPGPCGAGAYVYGNVLPYWDTERTAALGPGTNNLGELWAVGLALQAASLAPTRPHTYTQFYIFTDSQFTKGVLTLGWRSNTHPALAKKIKQMIRDFPIPVIISWVPAHVGLTSNERADKLADLGSAKSAKDGPDVDVALDYVGGNFAPRIYDG